MTHPAEKAVPTRYLQYVPGYRPAKLALALLGVVLMVLSLERFAPLARLAVTGGRAKAEAVRAVQVDAAGAETVYTTDFQLREATSKAKENRDFRSVFWIIYQFRTADGRQVEVRAPIGQHVPLGQHESPMQPLRDEDGLPSTVSVWYDKANPQTIVLPWRLATWFMPGILLLFGFLGTLMGLTLWWHAGKPIEMPDLSPQPQTPAAAG